MDYKEMNKGKYGCECKGKESSKEKECLGSVLDTYTLGECSSTCPQNFPYYKVPVVLSEFTVQIDTESKIRLCEPAIEIKRIKKNVFLNQCRLIPGTCKVFISGYVRKNIEYATMDCYNDSGICGDIKHTTVHVPFQCMTEVKNLRTPNLHFNETVKELEYWDEKCMGRDMKEIDMHSEEYFNEKVYCELVHAKIYEADIVHDYEKLQCMPKEILFQTFIEKEVLCLTIKLLQNQQVHGEYPHRKHCGDYEKDCL